MTTKQQLGNMMWIIVFIAALTSPFWGQWTFGLGAILMGVAAELRKDPHLVIRPQAPRSMRPRPEPTETS